MKMYNERLRIMSNAGTTAMNRVTSAEMRANAALEKAKEEVSAPCRRRERARTTSLPTRRSALTTCSTS